MTPTDLRGICTFLLACWFSPLGGFAQVPGPAPGPSSPSASANQTQLPLHATQKREFAIPLSVDQRVAQPVEVHLYVSVDEG
ncbi:MAG: hypothetical protein ACODAD_15015, partial [Planctomycetota bacterium]